MPVIRTSFSASVADRLKSGATVFQAIHDTIGGIRDGSGPRTTDILLDLQDMGVWKPTINVILRRRRKV